MLYSREMPPVVSVLVPVFQRADLVGPCLESALAQSHRDFEVVVVDNASTDGAWDVIQSIARRDGRVRAFRNDTNLGPVRNWKRCLAEARGRLGKLLFSDDLLAPDYLAKTVPLLDDPQVAFAFTAAEVGAQSGTGNVFYRWAARPAVVASAVFLADALCGYRKVPLSPGAALFRLDDLRRDLLTELEGIEGDFADHGAGPDMLLYLLAATRYPKVAHLSEPLAFFRFHGGSISISREDVVRDRYHLARVWFALRHAPHLLGGAIAFVWGETCLAQHRVIAPRTIARSIVSRAGGDPALARIPVRELLRFGVEAQGIAARGLAERLLGPRRS